MYRGPHTFTKYRYRPVNVNTCHGPELRSGNFERRESPYVSQKSCRMNFNPEYASFAYSDNHGAMRGDDDPAIVEVLMTVSAGVLIRAHELIYRCSKVTLFAVAAAAVDDERECVRCVVSLIAGDGEIALTNSNNLL